MTPHTMPPHTPVSTRGLITAALFAGVPAGLIYALATLVLAAPVLFQAEAIELGTAAVDHSWGRTVWTFIGSIGLGTGLALLLAPLVRVGGPPTLTRGMAVAGFAFVALILAPGLWMAPVPPGVTHHDPVAHRQAAWLLSGAVICLLYLLAAGFLTRMTGSRTGRNLCWAVSITGVGLLSGLYWHGGLGAEPLEAMLPDNIVARFRHGAGIANALLFLSLAALVPTALRRIKP